MEVTICTALHCAPTATIDLPVNSWSEIKDWYVKWDTLHFTTDGEVWQKMALENDTVDAVDWKRPLHVSVTDAATGETYHDENE